MTRTRIKICGITSPDDAKLAIEAGADALGLVFYEPSPRFVSTEQAKEICKVVPAFVSVVGLCVDKDKSEVDALVKQLPIDLLQFHGDESPSFCEQFDRPYIKAIRMRPELDVSEQIERYNRARSILLDAYRKGIPGGTGEQFNWKLIPEQHRSKIILAGGLKPENIQNAIQTVQPYAVDVSGGVECSPGVKDRQKVLEFVKRVAIANA